MRVTFYKEDIRNKETIADIVKREQIDTCIHLAAKISVTDSIANPFETVDVNVNGTLSLLDACARNDVKSFIFASSAAVYGSASVLPIPEDHVLEPLSPYGASKVSGEALITSYKGSGKIKNALSLRFFNIYGEGQSPQYAGVITKFAERLARGLPPIIFGTGEQTRDFVSVNDVVNAIVQAAPADNGISGIFNIGTGKPISINELARKMIEAFKLPDLEPLYDDALEGDIMHSYADITRSKEILGFSPPDTIESSLKETLTWLPSS
jgi:UDP-glucose 4-epimerase